MAPGDRLTADEPVTTSPAQDPDPGAADEAAAARNAGGEPAVARHTGESHDDPQSARTVETAASPRGSVSAETEAATTHEAAQQQSARAEAEAEAERAIAGRAEAEHAPASPASAAHATAGTVTVPAAALIDSTQIRRAVTIAEKRTNLKWSVFVGSLGEDSRAQAEARHAELGPAAAKAVLIAVDPASRRLEIVTGADARAVLDDRSCALAAASMTSTFAVRDLDGGIAYGILAMVEHVRQGR